MKIPWDKLSKWQKRMALIMGLVVAISYLQPKAVKCIRFISGIVQFQLQIPEYENKIKILTNFVEVSKGVYKAQMEKVDSLDRYVKLFVCREEIEVKVDVRIGASGDCKVFVDDGNVGMYATYYNYSIGSWEYYDFENKHHLTYVK
jgi:hypothetical protein